MEENLSKNYAIPTLKSKSTSISIGENSISTSRNSKILINSFAAMQTHRF